MKVKVSETTNIQLDWMVAKCLGLNVYIPAYAELPWLAIHDATGIYRCPKYSTDWALAGPIIGREHISLLSPTDQLTMFWVATIGREGKFTQFDHDPLIAAMRCYVTSRLGDEVEVPEELA